MRVVVIDTETTGDSETDQVVEVAAVHMDIDDEEPLLRRPRISLWSSLFCPTVPVQAVARASHHITDKMLSRARRIKDSLPLPIKADVLVAHNAAFDLQMLVQSGVPREHLPEKVICTWRCSMHLWPDAPKHSNQVLRYHLVFDPVAKVPGLPHRALPDAALTAGLLRQQMKLRTVEELITMSSGPILLNTVRFGKYRGMKWSELEDGYLHWILSKSFGEDEKYTAQHWISERKKLSCQPQTSAE